VVATAKCYNMNSLIYYLHGADVAYLTLRYLKVIT
jgi:hypothetical protein